jgi:GntR family transcriptional regulator of vanillate catabolism
MVERTRKDFASKVLGKNGRPVSLEAKLYDHLKMLILAGKLLPGERVVPEQLAQELGVSRTPIVSALKRLSQESLFEWRPRRGVVVRRLSLRELALTFEIREVLEGLAARRAAQRITDEQLAGLRALFDDVGIEETPANHQDYLLRDWKFHTSILEIGDSQPLTHSMQSLHIMVLAFGGGVVRPIKQGLAEHEPLFDALEKRDPDAAEAAMRWHINQSVLWLHGQADALEKAEASGDVPGWSRSFK